MNDLFATVWLLFVYIGIPVLVIRAVRKRKNKKEMEEKLAKEKKEKEQEQKRIETARKLKLEQNIEKIDRLSSHISQTESDLTENIRYFLCEGRFASDSSVNNYLSAISRLNNRIVYMQSYISDMKKANDLLMSEYPGVCRTADITTAESLLTQAEKQKEDFRAFWGRVVLVTDSHMVDEKSYGKINTIYWDKVRGMVQADAVRYVSCCEQYFADGQVDKIYAIDLEKVLRCVWFFALEKPFSSSNFQKAVNVFTRIWKQEHADVIIADLYAKKTMGGEDTLRETVRDMLKYRGNTRILTLVASSLMWMNAYQTENMVLQHMLAKGHEMTAKMQERLHSLTNGGGKAPSGFDVKSSTDSFYFDVSSLTWKDDEYAGLFENLAFQDKKLTYSLAVRTENKELFIPQGITVPDVSVVMNKFNSVFSEEYGKGVAVRTANCIALSGSGEEKMEGILVSSSDCKQMDILILIARIGKKLTIKFYTLFTPTGTDLAMQKQQALSLYKKLSHSVAMWENSLLDTMLMAVEQLLNASAQGGNASSLSCDGESDNELIF